MREAEAVEVVRVCAACLAPLPAAARVYCCADCKKAVQKSRVIAVLATRFWSKVKQTDDCWEWLGARQPSGHGWFRGHHLGYNAHRVAYQLERGPIPEGLELDHLCRHPWCVRPSHLEPVSHTENVRRGLAAQPREVCLKGHPLVEGNIIRAGTSRGKPARRCRTCYHATRRAWEKKRAAVKS